MPSDITTVHGILPPLITPLAARDTLDPAALERVIDRCLPHVHGLFLLGSTGESAALPDALRREVITRATRHVAGRLPILVAVTDTNVAASIALARHAADAGADAVVIATPYYLPLEQSELITYAHTILDEQPLPVFLYNMPGLTKTAYAPETVRRLADHPRVAGIKDSSGDLAYLATLRAQIQRPDFRFFTGTELHLPHVIAAGGHGCVAGGAMIDPPTFATLYAAARAPDTVTVAAMTARVERLNAAYRLGENTTAVFRAIKCALALLGVAPDTMAEPYRPCSDAERAEVRRVLADLHLLP